MTFCFGSYITLALSRSSWREWVITASASSGGNETVGHSRSGKKKPLRTTEDNRIENLSLSSPCAVVSGRQHALLLQRTKLVSYPFERGKEKERMLLRASPLTLYAIFLPPFSLSLSLSLLSFSNPFGPAMQPVQQLDSREMLSLAALEKYIPTFARARREREREKDNSMWESPPSSLFPRFFEGRNNVFVQFISIFMYSLLGGLSLSLPAAAAVVDFVLAMSPGYAISRLFAFILCRYFVNVVFVVCFYFFFFLFF